MNRRDFLKYITFGFSSLYLTKSLLKKKFSGKLFGPSKIHGHKIKDFAFNHLKTTKNISIDKKVIIVGGGIAGLSAAWWLKRNGFEDFMLLELEKYLGGNSHAGQNYPWGAHYIPIANLNSEYQKMLFEELGIIQGYDFKSKLPIYNELFLCHEPEERLFKDGKWQNGLIPRYGLQEPEKREIAQFFDIISKLKNLKGSDQKLVFDIPLAFSSQDPRYLRLDKQSMASWLKQNNLKTKPLLWYINYCCLDDYGHGIEQVSAWAALHYFAARRGKAANADENSLITWPEGNNWIVKELQKRFQGHIQTNALVYKIQNINKKVQINYLENNQQKIINCDYAICAAPRFISQYIIKDLSKVSGLKYIPWLVANITLTDSLNAAWDNVNYNSKSLGYISSKHQLIASYPNNNIITYYSPLQPENRNFYQFKKHHEWAIEITNDLEKMHTDIKKYIQNIDIWLWGHGMISPSINFIWSEKRKQMLKPHQNIYFAHSDLSGISIFEEAQYHGIEAAKAILKLI